MKRRKRINSKSSIFYAKYSFETCRYNKAQVATPTYTAVSPSQQYPSPLIIFIVLISACGRSLSARSIRAKSSIFRVRIFSRDSFARVNPVRVHIHRRGEVIDSGLEVLAADFAVQLANAKLLVELDDYGFLVVAEKAGEGRGEGCALFESETLVLSIASEKK